MPVLRAAEPPVPPTPARGRRIGHPAAHLSAPWRADAGAPSDRLTGMKCLVTGATGYIGGRLVPELPRRRARGPHPRPPSRAARRADLDRPPSRSWPATPATRTLCTRRCAASMSPTTCCTRYGRGDRVRGDRTAPRTAVRRPPRATRRGRAHRLPRRPHARRAGRRAQPPHAQSQQGQRDLSTSPRCRPWRAARGSSSAAVRRASR